MTVERQIIVINKLGLHARAAQKLVRLCGKFSCETKLIKADRVVDAKSILGVLTLSATQGSELRFLATGEHAEIVADQVEHLFNDCFGEGE